MCGQTHDAHKLVVTGIDIITDNPNLNQFLSSFHQPALITIHTNIDLKRWNGHWRQSKERTALSYSGLHFGHYKALT